MTQLLTYLHLANALLCLLLALHFLSANVRRQWPLRVLGVNYLLYAHQSLLLVLQLGDANTALLWLRALGAMLLAPALYAYFLLLIRPDSRLHRKDLWHLLPAVLTLIAFIFNSPLLAWLDVVMLVIYASYLLTICARLRVGKVLLAHLGLNALIALRYLVTVTLLLGLNLLIEIVLLLELHSGTALADAKTLVIGALVFFLIHSATVYFALQRSAFLEWIYSLGEERPSAKRSAALEPAIAEQIFQQWLALIEQEKLFQQEFGITLSQAAKKLQVPARQLSKAVNQVYGQTFSVHLNDIRIAHAKELLENQPQLSITEVMLQSGFASKSNFNKEFTRVTGTAPSQFRAQFQPKT